MKKVEKPFLMCRGVSLFPSDQACIKSDKRIIESNTKYIWDLILLFCEKLEIDKADITETSSEQEYVEVLRELNWNIDWEGIGEGQRQAWEDGSYTFYLPSSSDFTEDDQYLGIQRCDGLLEQVTRVNVMDGGAEASKPSDQGTLFKLHVE